MEVRRIGTEEWNRALPETGFEVFHTPEALEVLDRHTTGELHLLAGYKGDRTVALFPLFIQRRALGLGKTAFSPPPSMGVPRLGPILMPASPKSRKREKLHRTFIDEILSRYAIDSANCLFRTIYSPSNRDPRPFSWRGFDTEPLFTYIQETASKTSNELLESCSRSLRREIRDARELDIEISFDDIDAAKLIHEQTRSRYREQEKWHPLDWEYVRDLTRTLAETDRCRVYTARTPSGEFLSGIIVLYSDETGYYWEGGTKAIYEQVSINSLIHWRILEDIVENPPRESITQYDLMGANTERLCRYKSKFTPQLVPYYVIESGGVGMNLAKKAYQVVGSG